MSSQERQALLTLWETVEFLIKEREQQSSYTSRRHYEIQSVRERLQEAHRDYLTVTGTGRLSTILTSQPNRHGLRVVVRQQDNRSLDDQLRFMTEIEDVESDRFIQGHYLMTLDKAYADFLERCDREECKI